MRSNRAATRRATAVLFVLVWDAGCADAPSADRPLTDMPFALAYVHDDCAPWDGPALTFLLSQAEVADPFDVSYPNLRITSWRPPARLAGSTIEWSGADQSDGYATLCESAESCETALGVRLRFDPRQDAADSLRGDAYVELPGRIMAGRLQAERIPFVALCG